MSPMAGSSLYLRLRILQRCSLFLVCVAGVIFPGHAHAQEVSPVAKDAHWSPAAAASYIDARSEWWMGWPMAARDHGTFCISCHTTAPFVLGRPALRKTLHELTASPNEKRLLDNLIHRVRLWNEVEPFYPDQARGVPKTSESRGTESILNALALVWRDKPAGHLSDDARLALKNMWALQLRTEDSAGSWAWLQFHNAPFEGDSQYYGTALAAIAVGSAGSEYLAEPEIQDGLKLLRGYLALKMDSQTALDRVVLLWASETMPGLLTEAQQNSIIAQTAAKQRQDGGFSTSSMVGTWKRHDSTPLDEQSDGYATGLVAFVLDQTKLPAAQDARRRSLSWLERNQEADGRWAASSLNKNRELSSDAGRFMSDAATAYAVLALENAQ
jgi:squalene-hopene/tetraprenyl-beta-curcumene cyclase